MFSKIHRLTPATRDLLLVKQYTDKGFYLSPDKSVLLKTILLITFVENFSVAYFPPTLGHSANLMQVTLFYSKFKFSMEKLMKNLTPICDF